MQLFVEYLDYISGFYIELALHAHYIDVLVIRRLFTTCKMNTGAHSLFQWAHGKYSGVVRSFLLPKIGGYSILSGEEP